MLFLPVLDENGVVDAGIGVSGRTVVDTGGGVSGPSVPVVVGTGVVVGGGGPVVVGGRTVVLFL